MAVITEQNTALDDVDLKILSMLEKDARLSNAALAEAVGLTASSVHERVKKLEHRGVIKGYVALVDPETLEPLERLEGHALLALAARIGEVRLIDNTILTPARAPAYPQTLQGEAITTCSA